MGYTGTWACDEPVQHRPGDDALSIELRARSWEVILYGWPIKNVKTALNYEPLQEYINETKIGTILFPYKPKMLININGKTKCFIKKKHIICLLNNLMAKKVGNHHFIVEYWGKFSVHCISIRSFTSSSVSWSKPALYFVQVEESSWPFKLLK